MTLDDGSSVALNTASAIAVDYSRERRRIRLLRGEAVFTVARDAARPFVVAAASGEAVARGTVFAVRKDDEAATVTVLESHVGVSYPAAGRTAVELSPGEALDYSRRGLGPVRAVDADAATAWRRGKLIFVDRPLGEVIAELNRYHSGRIQIIDGSISSHPVSGVFDTGNPLQALEVIEQTRSALDAAEQPSDPAASLIKKNFASSTSSFPKLLRLTLGRRLHPPAAGASCDGEVTGAWCWGRVRGNGSR